MIKKRNKFNRIVTGLFYISIMFLLAFSVSITKLKSENDIAHIFGFGIVSVHNYQENRSDLVVVRMIDINQRERLVESQVLSYFSLQHHAFTKQTIMGVEEFQGDVYYITQHTPEDPYVTVYASEVNAVEVLTIPHLGQVFEFVSTPKGFALGILLPVVIIWILESIILVNHLLIHHRKKLEKQFYIMAQNKANEVEHEFEVIRRELLKDLNLE